MSAREEFLSYDLKGYTLTPGDEFHISRDRGVYTFHRYIVTPQGEWIECFGKKGRRPRAFHAFPPDLLTRSEVKRRPRQSRE